jgi:hypothetical protein
MATFGYTTESTNVTTATADRALFAKGTPVDGDGTVDSISFYCDQFDSSNKTTNVKGAICASDFTLLGVTDPSSITGGSSGAWKTVTFSTKPSVVNNTEYYVGIIEETSNKLNIYGKNTANIGGYDANSYSTPTDLSAPLGSTAYVYDIYATYTAAGSTSPSVSPSESPSESPSISPSIPLAKLETLIDNFNDNSLDTDKWTDINPGFTFEQNDQLEFIVPLQDDQGGLVSTNTYDLTDSYGLIEIKQVDTNIYSEIAIANPTVTDAYEFVVSDGTLSVYFNGDSIYSDTYSPTNHRWLKVSEDSGTVYFSTSANGTSWTVFTSDGSQLDISNIIVLLASIAKSNNTTTVIFDNFNNPPVSSESPSESPSQSPSTSVSPSSSPSQSPSASISPSISPSASPSSSISPSISQSFSPSKSPSISSSISPSISPSSAPATGWVAKPMYYWDGSNWIEIDITGI